MTEADSKIKQQTEWTQQYTLSPDQFKQLILNKLRRASALRTALIKREVLAKYR